MCPNMEFFLVRIQSEYGRIQTRKNSVFGQFSRSNPCANKWNVLSKLLKTYPETKWYWFTFKVQDVFHILLMIPQVYLRYADKINSKLH